MYKVLMSINPKPVSEILNGNKKYEYRKVKIKKDINKIIIYETSPVKLVVGEVEVLGLIEGSLDEVYNITKDYSGINEDEYYKYFNGCKKAYAYKLGKVIKYKKQLKLSDLNIKSAPQSFFYIIGN